VDHIHALTPVCPPPPPQPHTQLPPELDLNNTAMLDTAAAAVESLYRPLLLQDVAQRAEIMSVVCPLQDATCALDVAGCCPSTGGGAAHVHDKSASEWQCDICRKVGLTYDEAAACEATHVTESGADEIVNGGGDTCACVARAADASVAAACAASAAHADGCPAGDGDGDGAVGSGRSNDDDGASATCASLPPKVQFFVRHSDVDVLRGATTP
jgi:hypothetical protein